MEAMQTMEVIKSQSQENQNQEQNQEPLALATLSQDQDQEQDQNQPLVCSLNELYEMHDSDPLTVSNKSLKFYGWIRRTRVGGSGKMVFIDIYDGTRVGALMCIATQKSYQDDDTKDNEFKKLTFDQLSQAESLSDGCSVVAEGTLVLSPLKEDNSKRMQSFELQVSKLSVIGGTDALHYPINKTSEKKLTTLRTMPFMRFRSQITQSLFRISSKLEFAVHCFMDENDVCKVDPNILTIGDCEGAGEIFRVECANKKPGEGPMFSTDENGKEIPVFLTVSSQLPLEAAITGFRQVYTCQKSFRAERSDTNKHLAEFLHVEYEGAFTTLDKLMDFTERFIKYLIETVFDRCKEDFDFIESGFAPTDIKPTRPLLKYLLDKPFVRIKHSDAIRLIHQIIGSKMLLPDDGKLKKVKLAKLPQPQDDLDSECEKLLVKYFGWMMVPEAEREQRLRDNWEFGAFVFLTHFPMKIKSFYMFPTNDGSGECESFDLLGIRVGELIGGSMRQWQLDKLSTEVQKRGMDVKSIQWYMDLRKSGSTKHGGFGLGFSRLAMLLSGCSSLRDIVPFPVYHGNCPY